MDHPKWTSVERIRASFLCPFCEVPITAEFEVVRTDEHDDSGVPILAGCEHADLWLSRQPETTPEALSMWMEIHSRLGNVASLALEESGQWR